MSIRRSTEAPAEPASVAVGVVNYRDYEALARCLESVDAQSIRARAICVVDHDPHLAALGEAFRRWPRVDWVPGPNRGFAAGANRALARLRLVAPDVEYLLLLNADIELECDFAETLSREMACRPDVALGSGKLLRRDGRTLDSAGIAMSRSRKTRDRGSEETDRGQFDRIERVFGVSGAALMLRASALDHLRIEGELFDEDFHSYHEDTDLAWRARLFGWSSLYVPKARARHARGWQRDHWRDVDPAVRRHSFKNRYLEMIKNERGAAFLRDLPAILAWEGARLGYALLRDPARLGAYRDAWRSAGKAWAKRRAIMARADARAQEASSPPARRA